VLSYHAVGQCIDGGVPRERENGGWGPVVKCEGCGKDWRGHIGRM